MNHAARLIVTGAAGKLGRSVVAALSAQHPNQAVTLLDLPDSGVAQVAEHEGQALRDLRVVESDLMERTAAHEAVAGHRSVLHLAGVPRPGLVSDAETFKVNVMTAFNICEAAGVAGVERLVFASSTAVLGTDWGRRDRPPQSLPFDESSECRPQDSYGTSKLAAECVVAAAVRRYEGMSAVVLRPAWLVSEDEMQAMRVSGGPERGLHTYAWLHLDDAAEAFLSALEVTLEGPLANRCEYAFLASPDSSITRPLSDVYAELGYPDVPGLGSLGRFESGLSSRRAHDLLGWSPDRTWRGSSR